MTDARIGWSAEFWLAAANGTLTQLDEIIAITPPQSVADDVEATHMLSPNRRREYIAGLIEDGEGDFEMNYVAGSATDNICRAALNDGEEREYRIVIPDGAFGWKIEGTARVRGYVRNVPIDDRMTATVTLKFSGSPVEAAAAS